MAKIDYKSLPDVSGKAGITTIKALAAEFKSKDLEISQILRAGGLEPIGKIPNTKDGKPHMGKPMLGFDATKATKLVKDATSKSEAA